MKTILSAAALAAAVLATPAAASTVLVINFAHDRAPREQVELTLEQRAELAAEAACAKPFIRNLGAQRLYAECLVEARAEVAAILAERQADERTGTELAAR
ncbi:hypothetical protein M3P36_03630 [Altererythrobacter sp. KTW20L]|uniref:hypothetical protein n=1 Tax=Altererythrobacter sp. KTW20L TaxID=2942210 RepID=UPI0020C08CD0|nr:hypothetical protein [Altererythrobacter sp. KTW20L]MCL6250138.1 hypothetical protein [Altererythrobacter sp. KTW20L]